MNDRSCICEFVGYQEQSISVAFITASERVVGVLEPRVKLVRWLHSQYTDTLSVTTAHPSLCHSEPVSCQ